MSRVAAAPCWREWTVPREVTATKRSGRSQSKRFMGPHPNPNAADVLDVRPHRFHGLSAKGIGDACLPVRAPPARQAGVHLAIDVVVLASIEPATRRAASTRTGGRGIGEARTSKNAAEARHRATAVQMAGKVNVCLRAAAEDAFFPRRLGACQSSPPVPRELMILR